jgi:hypothetical protein
MDVGIIGMMMMMMMMIVVEIEIVVVVIHVQFVVVVILPWKHGQTVEHDGLMYQYSFDPMFHHVHNHLSYTMILMMIFQ